MGFIRGSLLFFSVMFLIISLFVGNLFLTFSISAGEKDGDLKDFWMGKFYYLLFFSLILAIAIFFLVETKADSLLILGASIVGSSLPFMKVNSVLSFFDNSVFDFNFLLLSESYRVFVWASTIGIVLISIGIGLRFFGFGISVMKRINEYFKDVKPKEEMNVKKKMKGKTKS